MTEAERRLLIIAGKDEEISRIAIEYISVLTALKSCDNKEAGKMFRELSEDMRAGNISKEISIYRLNTLKAII